MTITDHESYAERTARVHAAIAEQNDVLPQATKDGFVVDLSQVDTGGRGYGGVDMKAHEQIATTEARGADAVTHDQILADEAAADDRARRVPKPDPSQGGRGGAGVGDCAERAAAEGRTRDALRLLSEQLAQTHTGRRPPAA